MTRTIHIIVLFCAATLSIEAFPSEDTSRREESWREELHLRFDVAGWAGKKGPVVAGVTIGELAFENLALVQDHAQWTDVAGETVLMRQFATPDHGLRVKVAVARSCETAHRILFDHLARPRSMAPLPPPALPYGSIRLEGIGDVCFARPGPEGKGFSAIEFVRFNVAVLLEADPPHRDELQAQAGAIDQTLLSKPVHSDWKASGCWPSIDRFQLPSATIRHGTQAPLRIETSHPRGEALATAFEATAGGIWAGKGGWFYYAEGDGLQTLSVMQADARGLAAGARFTVEVVPGDF